jgi:acetyl-CoA C-acetyltransferase
MREVAVIGIGQTPVGELWKHGLRDLAQKALTAALADAGLAADTTPDALYTANMLSPRLSKQAHLGALVADQMGWRGIEAYTIEAACASGGAAFQTAVRAVASGMIDLVAVCGVEKMTDTTFGETTLGLATAADTDYEVIHGATFVGLNALIMQRYMHHYGIPHHAFAPFSVNAHANAAHNPNAMFRKPISTEAYNCSPVISDPVTRHDASPICDGAAAIILCPLEHVPDLTTRQPVRVLASATGTDTLATADRRDITQLDGARASAQKAYTQSGLSPADIDIFELHDAFTIIAALSLEAAGFADPGCAPDLAADGAITTNGRVPISTMGGLKGRGHPVGATGVYELVDLITQLRGDAPAAIQVPNATIGLTQNIGGTGATVVTHILGR